MNIKRLLFTFLALFGFIFLFEWLFHGVLLKDLYAQSKGLWRPEKEMLALFHFLAVGQAVMALIFSLLFALGFATRGVRGGILLGVLLALFGIGATLMNYAVQPLPPKLITFWALGGMIEMVCAGAIAGLIYQPRRL